MDNAIVKGWLTSAMELDVMNMFICLSTPKRIWDATSKTYFKGTNRSLVYDLSRKAMQMRQAEKPLANYYAYLHAIWQAGHVRSSCSII